MTKSFYARLIGFYVVLLLLLALYQSQDSEEETISIWIPYALLTLYYAWIVTNNMMLNYSLRKSSYIPYGVILILGISLVAALRTIITRSMTSPGTPFEVKLIEIFIMTVIASAIYLAFLYMQNSRDFFQLKLLNKELELNQLKNQLNPHFLFNSLNNIYRYNLENNDYGNELILKLGDLMRFTTESSKKTNITLGEEIAFLENYLALEKERLGHRCQINFKRQIEHPERKIPPIILFPFIENAVKHGTNTNQKTTIQIEIIEADHFLSMRVENKMHSNDPALSTSTGLDNIRRRLELMFPGKHTLKIEIDDTIFVVLLRIAFNADK